MSATDTLIHPPPAATIAGSPPQRPLVAHPSQLSAGERHALLLRLSRLRTILPAFAQELAKTRRQLGSARLENRDLQARLRALHRQGRLEPTHLGGGTHCLQHPLSIELTDDQSARIETLPEDCTIVGAMDGCPLVRQASGAMSLLRSDGLLSPTIEHGIQAVKPYTEIGAS